MNATASARLQQLGAHWRALPQRQRRLAVLAAVAAAGALLWWIAIAPALTTLRAAPAQQLRLQTEYRHMRTLQQEAEQLKTQPRMERQDALQALEQATRTRLGEAAQMSIAGEQMQVSIRSVDAAVMADWLTDARANARSVPIDARLTRSAGSTPDASAQWSGTLVMTLPQ